MALPRQAAKEAPYQNRIKSHLLSPQRLSAERKQTPQIVESHRSR